MIDAVFISDLHLHPDDRDIKRRFDSFVLWAKKSVKSIHILGDFFHAWPGDDALNDWGRSIAQQLRDLSDAGISLFYMHGNRDFLLGNAFAALSGWVILPEPSCIQLGEEKVLLAHGDRYCIKDTAHQVFRLITRNRLFTWLFLHLLKNRERLVSQVRELSQENKQKPMHIMDVVDSAWVKHLLAFKSRVLIHGHTHKPGINLFPCDKGAFTRYVLSDWDDTPKILCYDNTKGFYFTHGRWGD